LLSQRGEKFFDAICDALAGDAYRFGVVMIDAAHFVPQSRQRIFFIGVDNALPIPADIIATGPAAPFHSPMLVKALRRQRVSRSGSTCRRRRCATPHSPTLSKMRRPAFLGTAAARQTG
jgi:site-specific DNA-cytosine methylase